MDITTSCEGHQVLFLEESQIHKDLFDMWLPAITTKFVSSVTDLHSHFNSNVVVTCLSESLLGEQPDHLRNYILGRNPFCQLILVKSPSSEAPESDRYDAVLERPLSPESLRATVEKRANLGLYSTLLYEFYLLNAKLSSIEQSDSAETSETNQVVSHYHNRLQEIIPTLNQLQRELHEEDVQELWATISRHREFLTQPNPEVDAEHTSKHHPNRCPKCKLPWGHDHENELGVGFIPLGAQVWKCTRCDEITHGVAGSQQRIV